jgi:hypothetical protein
MKIKNTTADQMEPGKVYITPGTRTMDNTYYTRPKTPTAAQFCDRLRLQGTAIKGREVYWLHFIKTNSDAVLVKRSHRGTDTMSMERYEHSEFVLIPADTVVREVKHKPGYKTPQKQEQEREAAALRKMGSRVESARSEAVQPVTILKDTSDEAITKVEVADVFSALRASSMEVEDALQAAVDEAIEGHDASSKME